jgi:hypothetical protein
MARGEKLRCTRRIKQMFCKLRGQCEDTVRCQRLRRTAEDGKKALAYHGAVPMVVYGLGEKNIREVRTILAANGYFTLNMGDSGYGSGAAGGGVKSTTRVTGDPTTGNPKQRQNTGSQFGFTHQRLHSGTITSQWALWGLGIRSKIVRTR